MPLSLVLAQLTECIRLQARQSHKIIGVVRIETTTDNQQIAGLSIPNAVVETVLQGIITEASHM